MTTQIRKRKRDITVFSDDVSWVTRVLRRESSNKCLNLYSLADIKKRYESGEKLDSIARQYRNILVFVSGNDLPEASEFLHRANRHHHLSALLVRDADPYWAPQLLDRANIRALRNTFLHSGSDFEVPKRVLNAWVIGAEKELIADATVLDDKLLVLNCAMRRFECSFDDVPALKRLPEEERSDFEISESGSYIHWPQSDIHIDLDVIRYAVDEKYRRKVDKESLEKDQRFGQAVAALRKEEQIRQTDVPGLSARQVRRIEKGESLSSTALEKLAKAHDLDLSEYLNKVAEEMSCMDKSGEWVSPD